MKDWMQNAWSYKCPRCRTGKLFVEPLQITKPLDMPSHCAHCKQDLEPEPGFYFGAMFISYIIGSFIFLAIALTLVFAFKWSVEGTMLVVLFAGLIIYLKLLRLSRSVYIHMIVKYEEKYK